MARLVYFAGAPWLVVLGALLFETTGALVALAAMLAVFFAGSAARSLAGKRRLFALALSRELAFEAYYREHPPKPFAYYALYPLLLPYWLLDRRARREAWLFKGYTLFTFAWLVATSVVDYFRCYPPELGPADAARIGALRLAFETALVLTILVPVTTSVVKYHLEGARRRLAALAVVGAAGLAVSALVLHARRDPIVSFAARRRLELRTERDPAGARAALLAAL
ncbi:MAG TPA: hypothetical protein VHB21_07810, partial [Minicystis sp.]|nr:hypothetical protein [Minicystis sp.]